MQAEKQHQQRLAPGRNATPQHDRHREGDQQQVGYHVAGRRDGQVHVALPTMAAGVGHDLPVLREGVALGKGGDADADEAHYEEDARVSEQARVTVLAGGPNEAVEEGEGGFFEKPKAAVLLVGVVEGVGEGEAGGFTLLGGGFD